MDRIPIKGLIKNSLRASYIQNEVKNLSIIFKHDYDDNYIGFLTDINKFSSEHMKTIAVDFKQLIIRESLR